MNYRPRTVALILIVGSVAAAIFFYGSFDRYKGQYSTIDNSLSNVRNQALTVADEFWRIIGRLNNDYDNLTSNVSELVSLVEDLEAEPEANIRSSRRGIKSKNRSISPDMAGLAAVVHQQKNVIEDFKSAFSILTNARQLTVQLLDESRELDVEYQDWQRNLGEIEIYISRQNRDSEVLKDTLLVDGLIDRLISNVRSEAATDYLYLLQIQNEMSVRSYHEVVRQLFIFNENQDRIALEVDRARSSLEENYAVVYARKVLSTYLSGSLTLLVLIFGCWQARLAFMYSHRLREQNQNLEKKIEVRTAELETRERFFRAITETATDPILLVEENGFITFSNGASLTLFGLSEMELIGQSISILLPDVERDEISAIDTSEEFKGINRSGDALALKLSVNEVSVTDAGKHYAIIIHDISSVKQLEKELSQAHKLESVGQLAAGIAHEINTPAQFISDNMTFLKDGVKDLFDLLREIVSLPSAEGKPSLQEEIVALTANADLEYLAEEIPAALDQSADGINRIATIVKAMKDYSHPGEVMEFSDLNRALESTITISKSEWKYFAELETQFDPELPLVECIVSDINQVILNMIVNAAHAIVEKYDDAENKAGRIIVSTRVLVDSVEIVVSDNGNGMPEQVKQRIFDPFFTTKSVGKGTGQGLSIAHNIVVVKHQGDISVSSKEGEGTRFEIRLPVKQISNSTDCDAQQVA